MVVQGIRPRISSKGGPVGRPRYASGVVRVGEVVAHIGYCASRYGEDMVAHRILRFAIPFSKPVESSLEE